MESIKQEKSNLMSINPISKHMSTPINMGGSYSKSPAKATNFPIKEKTKLGKD